MKKILALLIALALGATLLTGCFRMPKKMVEAVQSAKPTSSASSSETEEPPEPDEPSPPDSATDKPGASAAKVPAKNPSEGYTNYSSAKSAAMDRIYAALEESDDMGVSAGLGMLSIAMLDLSLVPLTVLNDYPEAAAGMLGMLGMEDVKVDGGNGDYTITYKNSEGQVNKQTCKYDVAKDQLTSTLYDQNGKESLIFEYVNLGGEYASQYYFPSDDGYETIRFYFDMDNVAAYASITAKDAPASIIGKSGFNEDFITDAESYLILKDGKLTVMEDGEITTG